MRRLSKALSVIALVTAGAVTGPLGAATAAPGDILFADSFDTYNSGSWTQGAGWYNTDTSHVYYLPDNARVSGGALQITTRSHCTAEGEKPSMANATGTPCTGSQKRKYSTGRLQTRYPVTPRGVNYRIKFSALMPTNGKPGTRMALWARNTQQYCTDAGQVTYIGEFDGLEWYPDKGLNRGSSTSHMSCYTSDLSTKRHTFPSSFSAGSWYEWWIDRRGNSVYYYVRAGGAEPSFIGAHTCTSGPFNLSQAQCDAVLEDPVSVIINGNAFKGSAGPDDSSWFPNQTMLVDWVTVEQL
ncbi:hypothetical protein JQN72_10070 [Phycicoccus sp. CSK15P-2]|uniref:glycoside hydrolase family 16 protein n=1 Tax=Phycicoccus sp. CSK15P-2 TaxID=2807627 RepID=UPI0019521867|nr:hypothetical protein [Phycicoccus sp. CSK15P-2]MBM6404585.1 hypothetical protein [Phycicoccus sp. CSK15P-2]